MDSNTWLYRSWKELQDGGKLDEDEKVGKLIGNKKKTWKTIWRWKSWKIIRRCKRKIKKTEYGRIWWAVNHTMIFESRSLVFSINKIPKLTIFQVFNPKYKAKANFEFDGNEIKQIKCLIKSQCWNVFPYFVAKIPHFVKKSWKKYIISP